MTTEKVLLERLENCRWELGSYPLDKDEAELIIPLLEAAANDESWKQFEETEKSLKRLMNVVRK